MSGLWLELAVPYDVLFKKMNNNGIEIWTSRFTTSITILHVKLLQINQINSGFNNGVSKMHPITIVTYQYCNV